MNTIVLSGGGGKGAYQVGVWKALRLLNIDYNFVVGTSIGSINAAFMTSGEFDKCLSLWKNVKYSDVFKNNFIDNIFGFKLLKEYLKKVFKGGFELDNLKSTLENNLDKNKFYNSNIKFGLVTVKLPFFKECFYNKYDIPKERLYDYLIASSSLFPVFKIKKIESSFYVDGLYRNNMPFEYALNEKNNKIIIVDLRLVKLKKVDKKRKNIVYIKPVNKINSFITMNKKSALKAINYGYLDTLKAFNYCDGIKYSFEKGILSNLYLKYLNICGKKYKISKKRFLILIEKTFEVLKVSKEKLYNFDELVEILSDKKANNLCRNKYQKILIKVAREV